MQVSIENTGDLSRKMTITVPAADIDGAATERFEHIAKTVKMPGFRPGHVPMDVVKQKYSEQVMQEITQQVVSNSVAQAFTKEDIRPAGQPRMEEVATPETGKDFSFTVAFDIYPEIKPKGFEGVKITRDVAEPTDKMLEDVMNRLKGSRTNYEKKDGAAEQNDRVMLDGEGFKKGEDTPFEGGKLTNFNVVIGSGSLIAGFEDNLVGMKEGDEKAFDVEFPAEYHSAELAGQPATFKVKIVRVESPVEAELDDTFAKSFGAENVEDLKSKVAEQVVNDLKMASEQKVKRQLFDALDKENQFDVPENLRESEFNAIWQSQMRDLQSRGLGMEALGKSEDEVRAEFRGLADRRVRLGLILAEIGKEQDIKVTADDIKAEIEKVAENNPGQADQVRQYYADPQRQNEIVGPLFERKVTEWLLEKANITDKTVDAEELVKELS